MTEQIVRDVAAAERLARGLSEYYSRRALGVQCCDPLSPDERANMDDLHSRRLQSARLFVEHYRLAASDALQGCCKPHRCM